MHVCFFLTRTHKNAHCSDTNDMYYIHTYIYRTSRVVSTAAVEMACIPSIALLAFTHSLVQTLSCFVRLPKVITQTDAVVAEVDPVGLSQQCVRVREHTVGGD